RRRTAERPHLVDPEKPRGGGDEARAGWRRRDGDAVDAGHERRDGAHDQGRDEAARNVDAHGGERRPAPLELDPGSDLQLDVGWTLRLVPATNGVGELEE